MRGLFLLFLSFLAPDLTAQLLVIDALAAQPLEGATVLSSPAGFSAITDAKGNADLSTFPADRSIVVSHLGHATIVLPAGAWRDATVRMVPQAMPLNEVVISASRFEEARRDAPERIEIIKRREIAFLDQQSTPDLLQNSGALYVQRSQMGGGSPVIRGFEASRVLLVIDGVRMNNAIYRAGHLQDLMTVDQNAIERIEVISGPGSVVYGSDALGGVVHLITRQPHFVLPVDTGTTGVSAHGGTMLRTSTANSEKTASATVELRGRRWASLTSITASDFGDLRQGSSRNPSHGDWGLKPFAVETVNGTDTVIPNAEVHTQSPTAYKQLDVLQKLRMRTGRNATHGLNLQLSTSTDVPRYDRLSEYRTDSLGTIIPAQAEWYYGPQRRMLAAYTLEWERERGTFSKARITPSYQLIEQSRHSRGFGSKHLGHRNEQVGVLGMSADFEKGMGKHELRYGAEYYANTVSSTAYREHIVTGEHSYLTTRYPNGGSTMNTLAAFVLHTVEVNEHWILSGGLRFSSVELLADFDDAEDYQFLNGSYAQRSAAFNWRAGAVWMPNNRWRLAALASTGFRAPNVDDMGKVFDSTPGTVVVPNTALRPETTTNFELSIGRTVEQRFSVEGTVFYTLYDNALTVGDHTVAGQDSIDYDGVLSRVTALTNQREAYITGAQGQVVLAFNDRFVLRSGLTYTYGRIVTDGAELPLDHIPPRYGRTGLEYRAKNFRAECSALYNGWKRRSDYNQQAGSEDNMQYALPEGTPAWCTLNVRAAYAFSSHLSLQCGLENIADMHYRTFASGISAPGRNVQVSLRVQW